MFFSSGQKQVWMKNRVRKRKKSGKKRKGRKQISNKRQLAITILFLAVFISILHSSFLWKPNSVSGISPKQEEGSDVGSRVLPAEDGPCGRPEITEDFLDKNPYSRSGIALRKVKGVVIHYVENPGSTAKENRDYFNNLQNTHLTKASSHYIVGLDGEVIQCIPQSEISYQITGIKIRFRLSAAIQRKTGSLMTKHIIRLCALQRGFARRMVYLPKM